MEKILLIVFSSIVLGVLAQEPIVDFSQGQIQGKTRYSTHGHPYSEFLSIPFAQPPVGDLRFAPPLPADGWSGVRDGTHNPPVCPQTAALDVASFGDEDCLYLNVYSSKLPNATYNPNLPVIVWIYGGGYSRGGEESWYYTPDRFMDKDFVYISIAYRVGPFGFLSTADSVASGNWGALDQVLALKWVQANVAAFGGDPNHVTLQGESAGSTSVSYLVLSSAAAGLFHAAIGESGNALCSWSLQKDPLNVTIRMAQDLNCSTTDSETIVSCLRSRSVDDLVQAAFKLGDYTVIIQPFVPVIEDPAYGLFLTDWPKNILDAGTFNKVPYLTGVNHDEGTIAYEVTPNLYDPADDHYFDVILPGMIYDVYRYNRNLVNVSYAIKAEYYDKINITDSNALALTAIAWETDGVFLGPTDGYVKILASYGLPVYTYLFSYTGAPSTHHYGGETQVCHGDELPYLFNMTTYGKDLDANDTSVSDQLIEYWTNFAITYDPNPSGSSLWLPTTASEANYLNLLQPPDTVNVPNYRSEQVYFWNYIVPDIMLREP